MSAKINKRILSSALGCLIGYARGICGVLALFASFTGWALSETIDGVTWYYTVSDGSATITGATSVRRDITIPSQLGGCDVTRIANEAFRYDDLSGLVIPDTVIDIGTSAFRNCSYLKYVVIGKGVKYIGNSAFLDCGNLVDVTLPEGVETLDNFAFSKSSITNIVLPNSVTSIGSSAFRDCDDMTSVTIGSGLTRMGSYAFYDCDSLKRIVFKGDRPDTIGGDVFYGVHPQCSAYVNRYSSGWYMSIPGTWNGIAINYFSYTVRFDANGGVSAITSLSIEYGKSIGALPEPTRKSGEYSSFLGWFTESDGGSLVSDHFIVTSDMTVYAHWTPVWKYDVQNGKVTVTGYSPANGAVEIPSEIEGCPVVNIAPDAFRDSTAMTKITIPSCVTNIGASAFYGCNGLTAVHISDLTAWCGISFGDNKANPLCYAHDLYLNGSLITELIIPDDIMCIKPFAFSACTNFVSVDLGNKITNIQNQAFRSCNNLSNISFPDSVVSIGLAVFYGCDGLTSVTIPDNVKEIGPSPFCACHGLTNITVSAGNANYQSVEGLLLSKDGKTLVQGLDSIVAIPECVECIGDYAFYGCDFARITIPDGITSINEFAFGICMNLQEVIFDGNAPVFGASVFYNVPYSCRAYVKRLSTGWGTPIPRSWKGIMLDYDNIRHEVVLDPNGGTCETSSLSVLEGLSIGVLPEPTRDNAVFLGWFTEAEGGDEINESMVVAAPMTIYAHWLTEVKKPVIAADGKTVFRTDSCEVSITCATENSTIYYTDDGTTPKIHELYLYSGPITVTDTTTFKAVAVVGGLKSKYETVTITKKPLTLEEVLDVGDSVSVATDKTNPWNPIFDDSAMIGDSTARSAAIGNRTETWISGTVSGVGTMTFWCKTSCEHDENNTFSWDRLMVYTNDVEITDWRMDGEMDWTERKLTFNGGENTVKWVYYKDKSDAAGADCAWVDGVVWVPTSADVIIDVGGGKSVAVPAEWIDRYTDIVTAAGGDRAVALMRTAANGRKVWECFMLGVDPTKADDDFKITCFWMDGNMPKFEFNHTTDGSGNSFLPNVKPLGKAQLSDKWWYVPEGGNPAFRFFTVEVVPPGCEESEMCVAP